MKPDFSPYIKEIENNFCIIKLQNISLSIITIRQFVRGSLSVFLYFFDLMKFVIYIW